jgi:predicted  nucleic acid-binding Zn-ribbon protein
MMPHTTTCTRCGRAYDEVNEEAASVPAWAADRLCPACSAFEQRSARIRAALDAGRLADPADLDAQVDHIERENVAIRDNLAAAVREYADEGELAGKRSRPWHLRYEAHDDGAWAFHIGDAGAGELAGTLCGTHPTEPCGDAEHAEALRLLLGHDTGDSTWCPDCYAALAASMSEGIGLAAEALERAEE